MRPVILVFALFLAVIPRSAAAQPASASAESRDHRPFIVEAGGGFTTQFDPVISAAIGYSPVRAVTFLFEAERLHVPREVNFFENGMSVRPGFTSYMFYGQVRATVPINRRVSLFGLAGFGRGVWDRNEGTGHEGGGLVGPVLGGGVRASLAPGFSMFASMKAGILVGTDTDSVWGNFPIQGGVAWQF
jgi:hypothetical protein